MGEQNTPSTAINIDELSERLGGDNELLSQVIALFEDSYPQLLNEIDEAILHRDAEGLRRSAHTLKGMVSNLGAQTLAQAAYELEEMGQKAIFDGIELKTDSLKKLVSQFRTALREVRFPD